jgi:acyl-CoA thioester hydrolase
MQPFISKLRVSYSDTDQMGYAHHSNYLKYYEAARWNMFRHWGLPYKDIEEAGMLLPVVGVRMEYLKPAFYDEELTIETNLVALKGPKLILDFKAFNEAKELINTATITLAFVSKRTRKPSKPLQFFVEMLAQKVQPRLQVI